MAPSAHVQPPRGMRDFLPDEKARRDAVLGVIRDAFAAYGYREIETPALEELGRLEASDEGDNAKLIFRVLRRGLDPSRPLRPSEAADLGLRFDLTVPLARFYATHRAELPAVFRAIQVAPVWRAERPQRGRYRQFTQCDIDVIGEPGPLAEVELITATLGALRRLGVDDVAVHLNDRVVLNALLDEVGVPAAAQAGVLVSIDKLDKVGVDGVAAELGAGGAPAAAVERLVDLLRALAHPAGGTAGAWERAIEALPPGARAATCGLSAIRAGVTAADPQARLVADPTLVRGQGYYTGTIFELRHPSSAGAVGGGGRYDGMVGRFAGVPVPACGFSIGFERIVDLVDASRLMRPRRRVALVYGDGVEPGPLVAWQRRLIADGHEVRLVPRTRNLGRLLDGLAAEGFSEWAEVDPDTPPPDGGVDLARRHLTGPEAG